MKTTAAIIICTVLGQLVVLFFTPIELARLGYALVIGELILMGFWWDRRKRREKKCVHEWERLGGSGSMAPEDQVYKCKKCNEIGVY